METMTGMYARHIERKTCLLDGFWSFITDPENTGETEKWFRTFPAACRSQIVPGCWNTSLGLFDYEGIAWYSRKLKTEKENVKFRFHGVSGYCKIFLDGNLLGDHYGGFTGFDFTVTEIEPGCHTLTVMTDSAPNTADTIPLERVDWKHYGGIIRSVEVMELDPIWIDDFTTDYELSGTAADIKFSLSVSHSGNRNKELPLKISADDTVILATKITVDPGENYLEYPVTMEDVQLWSPENPRLYTFKVELGRDDIIERTGFRTVEVKDSKLLVNGEPVVLKGVNRHEEHPDWGFSVPADLIKRDMDIIEHLGCNSVRGSHYPNSELFLDLCDERGIMFWEEIPMWGFPEEALANETVLKRGLAMHEEMVLRDRHHPSIIMWGMHNEVDTRTRAGFDLTKKFTEKVRDLDSSRPLT
ncbi:MAG: glycoside hydrolase family 2 protein, partial [Spirochaetia bacterium]